MVERHLPEPDELDDLEEYFEKEQSAAGYESGLQLGKKHGLEEGYYHGFDVGAKRGSELGFYKGFSMTWISLLKSGSSHTAKSTKILNDFTRVLELVNDFPKTNETSCDEKLADIRLKFKQSTMLLNFKEGELSYSKI